MNDYNPPPSTLNAMAQGYLECALWLGVMDDGATPLDEKYTWEDFTKDSVRRVKQACRAFVNCAKLYDLENCGMDDEHLGHNLFLSAAGHGTGFWDRGLEEMGDRLHEAATKSHWVECAMECGNNRHVFIDTEITE